MVKLENILIKKLIPVFLIAFFIGCAAKNTGPTRYHDPDMDFSNIRSVGVMPFVNLTSDRLAGERVRDIFINNLLATGAVYVIPTGEVARGVSRAAITNPTTPSAQDIVKLAAIIKADAVITGVVREYGDVRSGTTTANVVSFSLQMHEASTQKIVWTASATKGGVSIWDRLFGGGGQPMNDVTQAAVNEILNKLFY
jgi:hypothetical protein